MAFGFEFKHTPNLNYKAMKTQILSLIAALLIAGSSALKAQDWPEEYLGLPGDNLNLYAVMNLFQNSETLEGFERSLNDPETIINNLDLNRDNYVDYIMVFNYADGDINHIVLRVALNEKDYQDVAVFVVEKLRTGAVQIQLIGDEALYGPNYIVEPVYAETPNPGYTGGTVATQKVKTRRNVTVVTTTYYEVASWPVIVYMHRPTYVVYRSPWRWSYYPVYWHAWTPHYWHYYYGYHYNWYDHYYAHYRPWRQPRSVHYQTVYYTSIRNYSPTVVVNINKGVYKNTYSRPETRKEGEVVYAQRRSTGSNLPPTRSSVGTAEGRQGSRPNAEANTRTTKSGIEGRSSTVGRDTETRSGSRQVTEGTRSRTETASPGRNANTREVERQAEPRREATSPKRTESRSSEERVRTTPSREKNVRTEKPTRPTESRPSVSPSRERSAAPARSVDRPKSDSRKSATQSAPSVSKRENTRSSSVESTKPSRSQSRSSGTVKKETSRKEENSTPRSSGASRGGRK
jgi:hypothetical protein